ncbi:MAG: restriction endonuclease subunit S [Smithella sp.]|jgi:restriction endonuclease S subunit|nr:restriction endonuclease subunit S [Smithella sp.]
MTTTSSIASRAFAVWWKDLERWVIPSNLILRQALPKGWERVQIGKIVRQVTARIKTEPVKEYKMAGVRWYGEGVFHRETVRGDAMSANQVTPLVAGALIYNRLFAWKASFAVVPPEFADCYVSSEFPQFIPDKTKILSDYLYLFCTREATIRAVNTASTGSSAVSRNRFKETEFLNFEISLPPLMEQKNIIEHWRSAQDKIAAAKDRIEKLKSTLHQQTHRLLGMADKRDIILPKAFALEWKHFERWSVEFLGRQILGLNADTTGTYPTFPLSVLCNGISGGTPSTKRTDYWHGNIPWISPKDMKSAHIFDSQDHITRQAVDESVSLVPPHSVLLVVRSGILQRTVPVAVNEVAAAINQDIRAFVPKNRDQLLPDYLAALLDSQQVALLRLVKWSTTVQSINKEELDRFPIPLPPLPIQLKIVEVVVVGREKIAREREAADRLTREINAEIEALILGTKKLNDIQS